MFTTATESKSDPRTIFVVAFRQIPMSVQQMQWLLFGQNRDVFPYNIVAHRIMNDMSDTYNRPMSESDIAYEIFTGHTQPESPFPELSYSQEYGDSEAKSRYADALAFWFVHKNRNSLILRFEYTKRDEFSHIMFSGTAFKRMPHIQIYKPR